MFTRTAPRALALAFAIVAVTVIAIVALAVPLPTAPTGTTHVVPCAAFADGNPTDATGGVCYLPTEHGGFPTLDTADYGTDIPRCATDDSNATHLARCYTESPDAVILVNADDTTLATINK